MPAQRSAAERLEAVDGCRSAERPLVRALSSRGGGRTSLSARGAGHPEHALKATDRVKRCGRDGSRRQPIASSGHAGATGHSRAREASGEGCARRGHQRPRGRRLSHVDCRGRPHGAAISALAEQCLNRRLRAAAPGFRSPARCEAPGAGRRLPLKAARVWKHSRALRTSSDAMGRPPLRVLGLLPPLPRDQNPAHDSPTSPGRSSSASAHAQVPPLPPGVVGTGRPLQHPPAVLY